MIFDVFGEMGVYPTVQEVQAARAKAKEVLQQPLRPEYPGQTPLKDIEISEKAADILDDEQHGIDRETIFDNAIEAAEYRNILRGIHINSDCTVPQTTDQKKACVKLLFKAFKSTVKAEDHEPVKKPFNENRHDNKLVESLCWSILYALIARSYSKNPLVSGYDAVKARNNLKITSFEERFNATVDALVKSKAICKHLFDAPYLNDLIDDPEHAARKVHTNRRLNQAKGSLMKAGKELKKKQQQGGEIGTPSHKRKRGVLNSESAEYDAEDGSLIETPISGRRSISPLKRMRSSSAIGDQINTGTSRTERRLLTPFQPTSRSNISSSPPIPTNEQPQQAELSAYFANPNFIHRRNLTLSPLRHSQFGSDNRSVMSDPRVFWSSPIQQRGSGDGTQIYGSAMPVTWRYEGFRQLQRVPLQSLQPEQVTEAESRSEYPPLESEDSS